MAQATLVNEGCFDKTLKDQVNSNFNELYTSSRAPVVMTAAGAISAAVNGGKSTVINSAAGIAITLPASTGSGTAYTLLIGTTITSSSTTITTNGTDKLAGIAVQSGSAGATTSFPTSVGTTITMNGSTKGGIIGDRITLRDMATGQWNVEILSAITSVAATPFS